MKFGLVLNSTYSWDSLELLINPLPPVCLSLVLKVCNYHISLGESVVLTSLEAYPWILSSLVPNHTDHSWKMKFECICLEMCRNHYKISVVEDLSDKMGRQA